MLFLIKNWIISKPDFFRTFQQENSYYVEERESQVEQMVTMSYKEAEGLRMEEPELWEELSEILGRDSQQQLQQLREK